MRLKSLSALGAPLFFSWREGGVRARVGVAGEDMVLAPESEFQLQAAYSRSASPPLWLQSGMRGHSSLCWLSPAPQPLLPVVLWEVLPDQVLGPWGQGPASALLDKILPSLRSLQLLTPETRHPFLDHVCPAFPERLGGSWNSGWRSMVLDR